MKTFKLSAFNPIFSMRIDIPSILVPWATHFYSNLFTNRSCMKIFSES